MSRVQLRSRSARTALLLATVFFLGAWLVVGIVPAFAAPSLTVNGSNAPITVAPGGAVSVSLQNGPGTPWDCVALTPTGSASTWLAYQWVNFSNNPGPTSATLSFAAPSTPGAYAFRFAQFCNTELAVSPQLTVQSGGATGDSNYVYDRLGRLIAVIIGTEMAIYQYDAVGNLLSITRQSSAAVSILDFAPRSGLAGASVTIYGTGFSSTKTQNTVTFNGVTATVVSATTTQLVVQVPFGGTPGPIFVSSPNGSATSTKSFGVSP